MNPRDTLVSIFEQDPDWNSPDLTPFDREEAISRALSSPAELEKMVAADSDWQALQPSEKTDFYNRIYPGRTVEPEVEESFYDKTMKIHQQLNPVGHEYMTGEKQQPFYAKTIGAIAQRVYGLSVQTLAGAIGVGKSIMDVSQLPAKLGKAAGVKFLGFAPDPSDDLMDAQLKNAITQLRQYGQKHMDESEEVRKEYGSMGQIAFDVFVDTLDTLPLIAAGLYTGGLSIPIGLAISKGYATKYGEMQAAGYDDLASHERAALTGVIGGGIAAFSVKNALSMGRPLLEKMWRGAVIDAIGAGIQTPIELGTDYVLDRLYSDDQYMSLSKLDPEMPFLDALKQTGRAIVVNILSGAATSIVPDMWQATKLKTQGLKAFEAPDGKTLIIPEADVGHIRELFDHIKKTTDPSVTVDYAEVYQQVEKCRQSFENAAIRVQEIVTDQEVNPLRPQQQSADMAATVDTFPKAPRFLGDIVEGTEFGIDPKFTQISGDLPLNSPIPAKAIRSPRIDAFEQKVVDVQFADGKIATIPIEGILQRKTTHRYMGDAPETPDLVALIQRWLQADIPIADMSPAQLRVRHGGWTAVAKMLRDDAQAMVSPGKSSHAVMVWDAALANPELLPRIISREIGHFINQVTPATLAKLGLKDSGITNFKKFITELGGPDIIAKYGNEMVDTWDAWALHPEINRPSYDTATGKWTGNPDDLVANALSLFINDGLAFDKNLGIQFRVSGETGNDPQTTVPYNYRKTQLYNDWLAFLDINPQLKDALSIMRSEAAGGEYGEYQRMAERVRQTDRELSKPYGTVFESIMRKAVDANYSLIKASQNDPTLIDIIDGFFLSHSKETQFLYSTVGPTMKRLRQLDITQDDLDMVLQANAIIRDRKKVVNFYADQTPLTDAEGILGTLNARGNRPTGKEITYNEFLYKVNEEAIARRRAENPNISDEALASLAREDVAAVRKAYGSEVVVQLKNPMGWDATRAQVELDKMNRAHPGVIGEIDDIMQRFHEAKLKWIMPDIIDSKVYSPAMIDRMINNVDYVTFDIVHHALDAVSKDPSKLGIARQIHRAEGTFGDNRSPFFSTIERLLRISESAKKASLLRNSLKIVSEVPQQAAGMLKDVFELTSDKHLIKGYEEITTKEWVPIIREADPISGKVVELPGRIVEKKYAVRSELIEGFTAMDQTMKSLGMISDANSYLRRWMTAYNPGFWFTNFFRDLRGNVNNIPGAGYLDMTERAYRLGMEQYRAAKEGKVTPLYETMAKMNLLQSGLAHADVGVSDHSSVKYMKLVQESPYLLANTWNGVKNTHDMFEMTRYVGERVRENWKQWSAGIGEAVEFSTKAAAYEYLEAHPASVSMTREQKNWVIRNLAGTPILSRRGTHSTVLSNLLLFFNPNVQGMYGTLTQGKIGHQDVSLTNGLLKRVAYLAPKMVMLAAALQGLLGEDTKEFARKVPVHHWFSGTVIPFGFDADGDAVYSTIPYDWMTELVNSAMVSTTFKLISDDYTDRDMGSDMLRAGIDQIPSLSPLWGIPVDVANWGVSGQMTDFRRQPVFSKEVMDRNDFSEKLGTGISHLARQGVFGPVMAFHRFPYSRRDIDPETRQPFGERGLYKNILTMATDATEFPGLSATFGRFMRSSQSGLGYWKNLEDRKDLESNAVARKFAQDIAGQIAAGKIVNMQKFTPREIEMLVQKGNTFMNELNRRIISQEIGRGHPRLKGYWDRYSRPGNTPEISERNARELLDAWNRTVDE